MRGGGAISFGGPVGGWGGAELGGREGGPAWAF